MSGHRDTDVAAITIATRQTDGTVLLRRWYACACCAESLADELGPPAREVLATRQAAQTIGERVRDVPGLLDIAMGES